MDLFEQEASREFATDFAKLASEIDPKSNNPAKNRPLEKLIATHTAWPTVSVKYIGDENQITNRFGEAQKKSRGGSRNLVVLTPERINLATQGVAEREMARGNWDVVALVIADRAPVVITHIFHEEGIAVPASLTAAFPAAEIRPVQNPTRAALPRLAAQSSVQEDRADYSVSACTADTGIPDELLERWLKTIRRKKQLVFQGPPGSGKTFVSKRLAKLLVAGTRGRVDMVQFHPSLTYEDFVQGLRPIVAEGKINYSIEPGRFMQFCRDARQHPESPYVLIIDEINRGNLSRIFGELLYLLEYREEAISLAQGDGSFSVPSNVYIVATMNTADRSIALVDHALRRRFSFVFLAPNYEHLSHWLRINGMDDGGALAGVLHSINQRIDDRHYHLGTSYFLSAGSSLPEVFQDIWEGEIEPHLEEFFFDQPEIAAEFSWSKLSGSTLVWWKDAARKARTTVSSAHRGEDSGPAAASQN